MPVEPAGFLLRVARWLFFTGPAATALQAPELVAWVAWSATTVAVVGLTATFVNRVRRDIHDRGA